MYKRQKNNSFKGLTLCLRPVKTYTYANDPNYRKDQQETKTLISTQKERATEQLQNIKEELTKNNFQSTTARTKIKETIKTIKTNIDNIQVEDIKPFPNFRKIKTDWKEIMTQLQDLEGISTRLHHEQQIKQIRDEIAITKGIQATERQKWDTNWINIMKKVEDNKKSIQLPTRTEREHTTREPTSETEEEEDPEEDQTRTTLIDYIRLIKEEFKLMARNYDEFCSEWQLNCGAIAWISLTMIITSLATMIITIILAVKTYDLTKKVNRLYEYMDAKATKKEQEEDDNQWKKRITNPNKTHNDYTPNPTRNKAKFDGNYILSLIHI